MLAKKTSKNQITLPKRIADQFPGTDYFDIQVDGGAIVLRPVQPDEARRVRRKLEELGLSERDIHAAVAWARSSGR